MQADYKVNPYRNFRFKLKMEGKVVAGFNKTSDLTRTTQPVKFRGGNDATIESRTPGQTEYTPLTLERGVTQDVVFSQWCNKVWDYTTMSSKNPTSLSDFRKDLVLEVYNEAGKVVLSYTLYNAWPSKFEAMPELDARSDFVAIASLVLQNEGWQKS
jgi:phage tail-like protein